MPISVFNDANDVNNHNQPNGNRQRSTPSLSSVLQYVLRTQSVRSFDDQRGSNSSYPSISSLLRSSNVLRRATEDLTRYESEIGSVESQSYRMANRNESRSNNIPPTSNLTTQLTSQPTPSHINNGNIYSNMDYYCPLPRQTADEIYANLRSLRLRRSEVIDQYRRSPVQSDDSSNCVDKLSVIDSVLDFLKIEKGLESESINNLTCSWLRPGSKFTGSLQQPVSMTRSSNRLNEDNSSLELTITSIDYERNSISGSLIISEPSIFFSVKQPTEEYWNGEILDPSQFCKDVIALRQNERKEHSNWRSRSLDGTLNTDSEKAHDKHYLNFSRLQGLSLFSVFSFDELIHHLEDPLFARKLRHRFIIMKWKSIEPEKHYFTMLWRGSGYIEGFVYEQSKEFQNQKLNLCPERRGSMGFPNYSFI